MLPSILWLDIDIISSENKRTLYSVMVNELGELETCKHIDLIRYIWGDWNRQIDSCLGRYIAEL